MSNTINRRGFITSLLASAAALSTGPVINIIPQDTRFVSFTEHFKWNQNLLQADWRYIVRIANIDTTDITL